MSAIFITLIAAAVGAVGAVLVAARQFSGRIRTSEASLLWAEAGKLREEYRDDIKMLEEKLDACQVGISHLEDRNKELSEKNGHLEHQVEEHEKTITDLRAHVDSLTRDNQALKTRNENVEEEAKMLRKRVRDLEEMEKGRQ